MLCGTARHVIVSAERTSQRRLSFQFAAYCGSHVNGGICCAHARRRECGVDSVAAAGVPMVARVVW
jgi:hypothetical protein